MGFLFDLGFVCFVADPSLFVYSRGSSIIHFCVYVDDIVVASSSIYLDLVISKLQVPFAMKNLGQLPHFLEIEAHFRQGSMYLSQSKYIVYLLNRASMLRC